jgi:REP element-mobilizing transposase RayT
MSEPQKTPLQVFDPTQEFAVVERRLPHWAQAGTIAFITWRTWDSMPAAIVKGWVAERVAWLRSHGIDSADENWRGQLEQLARGDRQEYHRRFSERWNDELDASHGECVLRQSEIAQIVADSLHHFDGDRYELTDFVIMPNHVHLLVAFPDGTSMVRQCESWKHFTATKINRLLHRSGHFWQQDSFDHLVRSVEQFHYLRNYIAENPSRSGLSTGQFVHWSKRL